MRQSRFTRTAGHFVSHRLLIKFAIIAASSFAVAIFDATGILLLVPLIGKLSGTDGGFRLFIPGVDQLSVSNLMFVVVGLFLTKSMLGAVLRWWSSKIVNEAGAWMASNLVSMYLSAPIEFHDVRNSNDLTRKAYTTIRDVYTFGLMGSAVILSELSSVLLITLLVLMTNPIPAIVGVAYFGLASFLFVRVIQPRIQLHSRMRQAADGITLRAIQEGLGGLRELRVRNSENMMYEQFARARHQSARHETVTVFAGELPRYYFESLFITGFALVFLGALATGSEGDALASLSLMLGAGFRVLPSISRLLAAWTRVKVGTVAMRDALQDLHLLGDAFQEQNSPPPDDTTPEPEVQTSLQLHKIRFNHIRYRYPNTHADVLKDVSFELIRGSILGIVGPSGAGKSTLMDIICGLRKPTQGEVTISFEGGQVANRIEGLSIGLVPQDVFLMDATISDNITFGLPLDKERLNLCLRRAKLDQFVSTLPNGVNSPVGERGTRISGGQRQRLGIARALYGKPSLLVFDEATAALDVETEAFIVETIEDLSHDHAVVVVAHRLSTVRKCNKILYLDGGQAKATGTFDEVRNSVPEFERAVKLSRLTRESVQHEQLAD